MQEKKRIILAISGASGAILGIRMLELLHQQEDVETHLVISTWGKETIRLETDDTVERLFALADYAYNEHDMAAKISSGSFRTEGMIIAPCSMKTLAGIANGYSCNLVERAADVALKERRKLVMLTRESPLSGIHLRNMLTLTELGAIIFPPVIPFYSRPVGIDDAVDQIAERVLSLFHIELPSLRRWEGES